MNDKLVVGIADMKMAQGSGMLVTYAWAPALESASMIMLKLAALLHIMLPLNLETGRKSPLKYADTGIRETLREMERRGAKRARVTAKIAGGAAWFEVAGGGNLGNIGQRNIESVHMTLRTEGVRLLQEDVGGTVARTLLFDAATGQGCVRCYGKPELIF